MSLELAALVQKPVPLIAILGAILIVGIGLGIAVEQLRSSIRREAWRKRNSWRRGTETRPDASDQLRIVMGADFTIQPVLNKSEARVLQELQRFVENCNPRWRVMAQVSLGEIVRSKDMSAFACVNSKRVDLLLVDDECLPRHAIEYQGRGHYQGTAAARDAVKKEALRRASIGYHEVVAGQTTPSELRRLVERLVVRPTATP